MKDLVTIDGSQGEGGGQVLRTALSLSFPWGQAQLKSRKNDSILGHLWLQEYLTE